VSVNEEPLMPLALHEGNVRESDDGHVFTGWCACGWEGDDRDAGTNMRSDETHADAYAQADTDLHKHLDDMVELHVRRGALTVASHDRESPRAGAVPSSWLRMMGTFSAESALRLLAAVDAAGVAHDDLDGVRRVWAELDQADS
jgi:hypothetical protein